MKLALDVRYPDGYPDTLPELSIEPTEGDIEEDEVEHLLGELKKVVRRNMVFYSVIIVLIKRRKGRREPRHGDDIYSRLATARGAGFASTRSSREDKTRGSGEGEISPRSKCYDRSCTVSPHMYGRLKKQKPAVRP